MTDDLPAPVPSYTLAGWREWVSLPGVGVEWIKAKLDTGARSSAIHAFDMVEERVDGERWVSFSVHPWQATDEDPVAACDATGLLKVSGQGFDLRARQRLAHHQRGVMP